MIPTRQPIAKPEPALPESPTQKQQQQYKLFADMDSVVKTISDQMPMPSSELWYRMELDTISRVYVVMFVLGLLFMAAITLTAIKL